jgi:hypothetical protein
VSLAVATAAVRAMRASPEDRLRSLQVLFVFPTGALLLATGGHDIPVLAVLLASLVLADHDRADAAGASAGVALAMRQTAVLAVPFILAIVPRGGRLRAVAWAAVPPAVIALPFVVWNPAAFVEDVVLFPLGLGTGRSSAQTPTIGSALLDLLPGARTPITIGLVVAIVASVVFLLVWRPSATAAGAGARAAVAFAVAIALAPAARFGYVVYPISLAVWANALRRGATTRDSRSASETSPAATGSRPRRRRRGRSRGSSAGTRRR